MSAPRWEDTPYPAIGFRPGIDSRGGNGEKGFEALQLCIGEDETCANLLRRHARKLKSADRRGVLRLSEKLMQGVEHPGAPAETLASRIFARNIRYRIAGNVWRLACEAESGSIAFVTLIRTGMWIPAENLHAINPRTLLNKRLVNDLDRNGVTEAGGGLVGTLDAEFDSRRGGYEFHWHLMVWGEKLAAMEKLRDLDFYIPQRMGAHDEGRSEINRVRVETKIRSLPDAIAYALKLRVRDMQTYRKPDGKVVTGKPRRIPLPHLSHWLLWMDRWRMSDFLVTQGLTRTALGLAIKQPA